MMHFENLNNGIYKLFKARLIIDDLIYCIKFAATTIIFQKNKLFHKIFYRKWKMNFFCENRSEFYQIIKLIFVVKPIEVINSIFNKIEELKRGLKQHLEDVSVDGRGIGDFRQYLLKRRVFPNDKGLIENKMFLLMMTFISMASMTHVYLLFYNETTTLLFLGEFYQLMYDRKIIYGLVVVFNGIGLIFLALNYYLTIKNKFHFIKLLDKLENKAQAYKLAFDNSRRFNLLVYLVKVCNQYLMIVMIIFMGLFNCVLAYQAYNENNNHKYRLLANLIVKIILAIHFVTILTSVVSCVCLSIVYLEYRFNELILMLKTGIEQNNYRLIFGAILR